MRSQDQSVSPYQAMCGHGYNFRSRRSGPLYATPPREFPVFHDCHFYHVMDLGDFGISSGHWDLRGKVDEYLGNVDFAGKSVLEIGPASGFLTSEMEKRGAEVIAIEVANDPGWDYVFFPDEKIEPLKRERNEAMGRLKASFWFTHKFFNLSARVHYGDVYNIPAEIGRFDIAVLAAVLLHTKNPHVILAECAKRADTIVITEMLHSDMEDAGPIMRFVPTHENFEWETWWHFTTLFFVQALRVMGFHNYKITYHDQWMTTQNRSAEYFTIVASRP